MSTLPPAPQWLSLSDFIGRVPVGIGFRYEILLPYMTDAIDRWAGELLSPAQQVELTAFLLTPPSTPTEQSQKQSGLADRLRRLIVYASWAGYILEGSVTATDTGLVEKERADSITITDTHRAELRRAYQTKIDYWAGEIRAYTNSAMVAVGTGCAPRQRPRLRFGRAVGSTRSVFESGGGHAQTHLVNSNPITF